MAKRSLASLIILSMILTPNLAWSQESVSKLPIVAVVGFQPSTASAESDVLEGVHAYLKGRSDLQVVPAETVSGFLTTMELQQDSKARLELKQAEELYRKGRAAYEKLKLEEAIQLLQAALASFNVSLPYLENNQNLLMTYLFLGMSKIALKRGEEGRADIRTMQLLDPQRQKRRLNEKLFPPEVVRVFNEVKARVDREPTGELSIEGSESGARILLDGNRLGVMPMRLTGLVTGMHHVTVFKRGFERYSQKIEVRKGSRTVKVDLQRWIPFRTTTTNPLLNESAAPFFRSAQQSLEANLLIVGELLPSKGRDGKASSEARAQIINIASGEMSPPQQLLVEDIAVAKQRGFRLGKIVLDHLTARGEIVQDPSKAAFVAQQPQKPAGESGFIAMTPEYNGNEQNFLQESPMTRSQSRRSKRTNERSDSWTKSPWFWPVVIGGAVVAGGLGVFVFTDLFKADADNNVIVIDNPGTP